MKGISNLCRKTPEVRQSRSKSGSMLEDRTWKNRLIVQHTVVEKECTARVRKALPCVTAILSVILSCLMSEELLTQCNRRCRILTVKLQPPSGADTCQKPLIEDYAPSANKEIQIDLNSVSKLRQAMLFSSCSLVAGRVDNVSQSYLYSSILISVESAYLYL